MNKKISLKLCGLVNAQNLVILALLLICGCRGVKLEQDVKLASMINCRYRIETSIWTRDWTGGANTLEYYEYIHCQYAQIDSVKQAEKEKAEKLLPKIIECYKRGCP